MISNTQKIYNAIDEWIGGMVDQLMPATSLRYRAKRGLSQLVRQRLHLDSVMPFLEDENGNLDVENLSNELTELIATLPASKTKIGPVEVDFTGESIKLSWPKSIVSTMLVGDVGSVRITTEDLNSLINIIKNQ